MNQNFHQLNAEKTAVKKKARLEVISQISLMNLKTTDQVKNMVSHIKTITKSAYYHLKSIARTKGCVVKKDSENLTHAFFQ